MKNVIRWVCLETITALVNWRNHRPAQLVRSVLFYLVAIRQQRGQKRSPGGFLVSQHHSSNAASFMSPDTDDAAAFYYTQKSPKKMSLLNLLGNNFPAQHCHNFWPCPSGMCVHFLLLNTSLWNQRQTWSVESPQETHVAGGNEWKFDS